MAAIELVQLSARRSGAGITLIGKDAAGAEHRFTNIEEIFLIKGRVWVAHNGSMLGLQPAAAPDVASAA